MKTITTYITLDGKTFDDLDQATAHEELLKACYFYAVTVKAGRESAKSCVYIDPAKIKAAYGDSIFSEMTADEFIFEHLLKIYNSKLLPSPETGSTEVRWNYKKITFKQAEAFDMIQEIWV